MLVDDAVGIHILNRRSLALDARDLRVCAKKEERLMLDAGLKLLGGHVVGVDDDAGVVPLRGHGDTARAVDTRRQRDGDGRDAADRRHPRGMRTEGPLETMKHDLPFVMQPRLTT